MKYRTLLISLFWAALTVGCSGDDSSSGDSSAGDEETSGDSGEEETGSDNNEDGPYWPCGNAGECFKYDENDTCLEPGDGSGRGFCSIGCTGPDDCVAHSGGTAPADCITAISDPVCVLDCSSGDCPGGMFCKQIATAEGAKSLCFNSAE